MGYGKKGKPIVIEQPSLTEVKSELAQNTSEINKRAYIKSSGFPFPNDLVSFWDFSEPEAPYYAKAGVDKFPLQAPVSNPTQVDSAPFGKGLVFNGTSDYLIIPASDVGALNVAKSGDEVTVVAWITQRMSVSNPYVAGMWKEDKNDPKRQYGLFSGLPTYGGRYRSCGHVSKTGGPSPNIPYSRDYSASGAVVGKDIIRCIGFTYDGIQAKSYVDGVCDLRPIYTEPEPPIGEGLTYAKNPYEFDLGLNRYSISDFTVGAVEFADGFGNYFDGTLSGLAVFRRALTPDEMIKIHLDSLPPNDPIQYFDFLVDTGTGTKALIDYGFEVAVGSTATDYTSSAGGSWSLSRLSSTENESFLYTALVDTNYQIVVKTGIEKLRLSQLERIEFTNNNLYAGNTVQFCIEVDGQWYVSVNEHDHAGNGSSGSDWSTGELKTETIARDKAQWLTLSYQLGTILEIGAQPANNLPNGEVTGIGFIAKPMSQDGSIIRIADLKLFSQ